MTSSCRLNISARLNFLSPYMFCYYGTLFHTTHPTSLFRGVPLVGSARKGPQQESPVQQDPTVLLTAIRSLVPGATSTIALA